MTREPIEAKAARLLLEGRVHIVRVSRGDVGAHVQGDTGTRTVTWTRWGDWHCTCPARGRCSHLIAVRLVTQRPPIPKAR
jgi:uncharacterized Zn finger protein